MYTYTKMHSNMQRVVPSPRVPPMTKKETRFYIKRLASSDGFELNILIYPTQHTMNRFSHLQSQVKREKGAYTMMVEVVFSNMHPIPELLKINNYKAPRDKLICILNCCKVIFGKYCCTPVLHVSHVTLVVIRSYKACGW